MVWNSVMVATVARVSAEAWQWLACIGEPLTSEQLLDLLCHFPFHQLCSFFCLPQLSTYSSFYYSSYYIPSPSDSDSDADADSDSSSSALNFQRGLYYHSHSD